MQNKEVKTESKSLHTKGVWSAHDVGDGWAIKESGLFEKGFSDRIAELYQYNPKANAERIVKCVNSHDELVKALQKAMDIIERINDEYSTVAKKHGSYTQGEFRDLKEALSKATN